MSIKSDRWIKKMSLNNGMIKPFEVKQVRNGKISFGLSSYGYDIRVSDEYKIFTNVNNSIVDPKHFDAKSFFDKLYSYSLIRFRGQLFKHLPHP